MKVYTRKGDDGTTGLLFGGRTSKDAPGPTAYGTTDAAVAALGRASGIRRSEHSTVKRTWAPACAGRQQTTLGSRVRGNDIPRERHPAGTTSGWSDG